METIKVSMTAEMRRVGDRIEARTDNDLLTSVPITTTEAGAVIDASAAIGREMTYRLRVEADR